MSLALLGSNSFKLGPPLADVDLQIQQLRCQPHHAKVASSDEAVGELWFWQIPKAVI